MPSFDSDIVPQYRSQRGRTAPAIPLSDILKTPEFKALPKEDKLRAVNNFGAKYGQNVADYATVVGLAHDATQGYRQDIRDSARDMAAVYTDTYERLEAGEITGEEASSMWVEAIKESNATRAEGSAKYREARSYAKELYQLRNTQTEAEENDTILNDINPIKNVARLFSGGALEGDANGAPADARATRIEELTGKIAATVGFKDAMTAMKDGERLAASDSVAMMGDGSLEVADYENLIGNEDYFVGAIHNSEASYTEKRRLIEALPAIATGLAVSTFDAAVEGLHVVKDSEGDPYISRVDSIGGDMELATAGALSLIGTETDPISGNRLGAFARVDAASEEFTTEQKEKAVREYQDSFAAGAIGNFVGRFVDGTRGLGAEGMKAVGDVLGFTDTNDRKKRNAFEGLVSQGAGRLEDLNKRGDVENFVGTLAETAAPFLLTRRIGGLAGTAKEARLAVQFGRAKAAGDAAKAANLLKTSAQSIAGTSTNAALAFGATTSAFSNVNEVLARNPDDVGGATIAGLKGFMTTFLVAKGFDKLGAGGAESFRARLIGAEDEIRKGARGYLKDIAKQTGGEFSEEFIDQYINSIMMMDYSGKELHEVFDEALMAGMAGSIFGGAMGARHAISEKMRRAEVEDIERANTVGMTQDELKIAANKLAASQTAKGAKQLAEADTSDIDPDNLFQQSNEEKLSDAEQKLADINAELSGEQESDTPAVAPTTPEAVAPTTPEAVAPTTPEAVAPTTPEAVAPTTPAATEVAKVIAEPTEKPPAEVKPADTKAASDFTDVAAEAPAVESAEAKAARETKAVEKQAAKDAEAAKQKKKGARTEKKVRKNEETLTEQSEKGKTENISAKSEVSTEPTTDPITGNRYEAKPQTISAAKGERRAILARAKVLLDALYLRKPHSKKGLTEIDGKRGKEYYDKNGKRVKLDPKGEFVLDAKGRKKLNQSKKTTEIGGQRMSFETARTELENLSKRSHELRKYISAESNSQVESRGVLPARTTQRTESEKHNIEDYHEGDTTFLDDGTDIRSHLLNFEGKGNLPRPNALRAAGNTVTAEYQQGYDQLSAADKAKYFAKSGDTPSLMEVDSMLQEVRAAFPKLDITEHNVLDHLSQASAAAAKVKADADARARPIKLREDFHDDVVTERAGDTAVDLTNLQEGDVMLSDGKLYTVTSTDLVGGNEFTEDGDFYVELTHEKPSGELETFNLDSQFSPDTLFVEEFLSAENAKAIDEFGRVDAADAFLAAQSTKGEKFTRVNPPRVMKNFLGKFENFLGRRIVFYKSSKGRASGTDGMANLDDSSTVYVSIDAKQPYLHIIGHEIAHTLQKMKGYAEFAEFILESNPKQFAEFVKEHGGRIPENQWETEFVADVVGSQFRQKSFWEKLAAKSAKLFRRFANYVIKKIDEQTQFLNSDGDASRFVDPAHIVGQDVISKKLGQLLDLDPTNPDNFVVGEDSDVDAADPFSSVALSMNSNVTEHNAAGHIPDSTVHSANVTQVAGARNTEFLMGSESLTEIHEFIDTIFSAEGTPINAAGIEALGEFVNKILDDPAAIQQRAVDEGVVSSNTGASAMVIAAARSAYFNYAARVSLHDAALGFKLVNRGMKLANEFRAEVDGLDARTAGQFLSSLRSTGDFSIMDMITLHNEGVDAYLVGRIKGKKNKTELLNNLNAVSAIDNIGEERVRELSETIDSEAGAQARIDTLELEAKVLQDRADSLMMDNIKALIGSEALRAEIAALQKSDVGKDGFGSMVEQYKAVLEGGGDIAQLRKIYDSVAPSMISDLANSGIPLGEVAIGAAEVSETSEQLFDTKDKLTQEKYRKANTAVDKLGKQFISTVRRQGDPPKAQSETSKKFKELIEDVANLKDFTQGDFISRYKKLGGDAELALEVYAAAKRQVAYKKKRSQTRANEAALKSAIKKEEAIQRKIIRDLEKIEGFGEYAEKLSGAELTNLVGMLKRFSGVKSSQTEAEFRKALTDAKNKDGGRKFSNEVVDAAVEKGKIVKAAKARASEAEAALKAAEQADKKAAATALRKAKKAADAADRDLKNIQGYGDSKTEAEKIEARKTPTSVLDAYTAVKSEMTDAEFKSALEGLVTKEGKTRLSPELVKEAISRGKVVKAKKLAVSAAKKALREAKAAEKKAANKKLTAAERGVAQSEKALKSIRKKLDEKVKAAKKVTPSTVIQKYTTTKDGSRISEEQLRKELSEIKRDADGERLLSDAAIDETVEVAKKLLKSNLKKKDLRQREGAENRLLNLFKARTSRKTPRALSLRQHLQDFFNDVSIKSFDAVERRVALKKFIEARGVGMTEAQINDMVLRATTQFEAKLTELKVAEVNRFSKQLDSGKVDIAMLNRIIRLQVLDPNKSFTELYATEKGYKGFNEEQFAAVMRDQQIISKLGIEHTASRNAAARQLRVVNLATGLNPKSRDLINGYIKGSIYSGISSQMVGIASGVTANLELFAGTLGNGVFDMLKGQDPSALADTMTVWGTAMRAGLVRSLAETKNVLKHNVSSVNQIQGGQETSLSYDHKIYNDPLIIAFDKNLAEIKRLSAAIASGNGKKGDRARQAAALLKVGLASQHIVFRGLSTADAAATQIFARTATEVEAFRLARKSGLTIEEYTETVKTANALYDTYKKDLTTMGGLENLTPNERHMFALDKVKKEIFESFTKYLPSGDPETKLAYIDQIYEGAVADIQDRLGTGQSSTSAIGWVNDKSARFARDLAGGAALFLAVRTTGNIADYLTWHMPVMNLLRLRRLGFGKIDAERLSAIQEVFPNIKSIEQAKKRRAQAMTANFSSLMVAALTIMNAGLPDDEKWFHFTGGYPVGDTHAGDLWAANGWTENMLVLGWGGFRTKWRMDKGLSSFLLPILYAGKTASRLYTGDKENLGADAVGFMAGILPFTDQLFSHGAAMARRSGVFDEDKPTEYKGVAQELSANTARLVIPYRGLLSLAAKNTSSVDRQSDLNFIQEVLKPVALPKSDNVIAAVNVLGEPLYRNTGAVARAVDSIGFPITFHLKQTGSPENRRAERVTSMLFRYKYAPKPKKFAALAKVAHEEYGVTLTAQQYSEIIASAGRQLAVDLDKNTKDLRSLGEEQATNRKAWVAEKVAIDAAGEGRAIDPYDKPFNKEVSSAYKDAVSDATDKVLGK